MAKEKKEEVNLSDIDANFVISSFKNKERRNNPSSIPRPLYPPGERERMEKDKEKDAESGTVNTTCGTTVPPDDAKRSTARQRKAAFEAYRGLFLHTPKIVHRKPVFISEAVRERLDEIARKLGDKGMSASGLLENMALHHLTTYEEDIDFWRKL